MSKLVGTEQEELATLGRTDQMQVALYKTPERIRIAAAEEAQLLDVIGIVGIFALEGIHVELDRSAIDERSFECSFMEQPHLLRWRIDTVDIAGGEIVGSEEFG